ncbi:ABC transporter substrate-binding protein [Paenibacillus silviterrae]|uniref:ABC transporter substrate-binding protein n=1 Tax=Paenibacillus silviterrae TaxID=3242194 RepID=UPI00254328E1|nr:ABC transporter substrate-binding protein [Paenibacillus chinjuensis]
MKVANKVSLSGMSILLAASLALTACSSSNNNKSPDGSSAPSANPTESSLPPVELTWYYLDSSQQADLASVETEVNKYIKSKLNATVKLKPIAGADYEQKMNTSIASGENFDLVWTSDWRFDFNSNTQKGAFLELDGLLDKYGQKLKVSLPAAAWDDMKVNGKIYGIPNYQIAAKSAGFVVQKRFADKYKLDPSKIKTYRDMEPFFEQIKQNEPGIIPFGINGDFFESRVYGINSYNKMTHKTVDGKVTVLDQITLPEYQKHVAMAHEWYKKKYINEDAATLKNKADVEKKGIYAATFDYTQKPGGEAAAKAGNGGNDVVFVPLVEPQFTGVTASITAVSRTSKHPERAVMLAELINTDPALYNMLAFGIENKHYTKIGGNTIKVNTTAGYNPGMNWVMGNVTIGYLTEGQPDDTWERTKKANEIGKKDILYGFKFNVEAVKAEEANLKAVESEFKKVLDTGTVDPAKYLPQFVEKRQKAGLDKYMAEYQRQIDEFLKNKGK